MAAFFAIAGGAALAMCQWLVLFRAPVEESMGIVQKIFYLHLPLAWWALASFFVVFLASAVYLARRTPRWDHLARAAAELGLLLAVLALCTGVLWGRRAWGVWWTWDPRLSTTLVMCLAYAGYMAIRGLGMPRRRQALACAVLGIVAFLDVPLVFVSARIWRSIHPAVFAGGGLDADMAAVAGACVLSMGVFWAGLLAVRAAQLGQTCRLETIQRRKMARNMEESWTT